MYALSLSSAFYLLDMPTVALAVAAIGTTLGWPFLVLTFLPVTVHTLIRIQDHAFLRGFIVTSVVMVLSIRLNHQFYGMWTSADQFFYDVVKGGVVGSYASESMLYYLKNGFYSFSFGYVFAWLFLIILPIVRNKYPDMLVVVSPVYILTGFMSLQPRKEERFLYSIYPLICVAASAVIISFPDLVRHKFNLNDDSLIVTIARSARPYILGVIVCISCFQTYHLTNGYSALEICKLGN
ncbi:alpha-1,2-mannosyltransferase ALG9-like [Apium graveolens]|uniref:alpha-1,2-mannosyltransferase ALG9-like n=1 Tax=Apium graveolens TaxID=4045 RepID=UPI003D78E975